MMPPDLSTIVVTPDDFDVVRKTVRHLAAQTVADRLELVIVAPSAERIDFETSDVESFLRVEVVAVGEIHSTGDAAAAGFRSAAAPLVTYVEEHAYPEPGWAEALIDAHRGPWAAVGGALKNANPKTAVSWASMLTDFGTWIGPQRGGETDRLPPHNSTYKKHVLDRYGENLRRLLETETVLFEDLVTRGERLFFEPEAITYHVNVSSARSYALGEWLGGRLFGAGRAESEGWSGAKRALYLAAAPLVPFVRLYRLLPHIRRCRTEGDLVPRVFPPLALGLAVHAVAEACGYVFGPGDAADRRTSVELDRASHLSGRDS